jgi:hypothetical protein
LSRNNEIRRNNVMTKSALAVVAAVAALAISIASTMPAQALSMSECSAKYKAAKDAGTLNGMKWNDFRKAQCGAEATSVGARDKSAEAARSEGNPDRRGFRDISERYFAEILERIGRQATDAHLS